MKDRLQRAICTPSREARAEIAQEEWDFSACPPDEAEECFHWELATHSQAVTSDVAALRREAGGEGFDRRFKHHGKGIFSVTSRRPLAIFYFCPEFPRPYLSVPAKERQRRLRLVWGDQSEARAHLLDARWGRMVPMGFETMVREAVRSKEPIYIAHGYELALMGIDWNMPDAELRKSFAVWLRHNRPSCVEAWPDRGEGLPCRKRKAQLRKLAAWRLLRSLSWTQAAALTESILGKPLFAEQAEWSKAQKKAAQWLASQEKFHC